MMMKWWFVIHDRSNAIYRMILCTHSHWRLYISLSRKSIEAYSTVPLSILLFIASKFQSKFCIHSSHPYEITCVALIAVKKRVRTIAQLSVFVWISNSWLHLEEILYLFRKLQMLLSLASAYWLSRVIQINIFRADFGSDVLIILNEMNWIKFWI